MNLIDILTSPWAIMPDKLAEIQAVYCARIQGDKIDIKAIEAAHGGPLQNGEQGYEIIDGVAVIPMIGVGAKRMNLFTRISGGFSTELLGRDIRGALADPNVNSIILEIESPGAAVDGVSELAKMIHAARDEKPIVAWANGLIASAAYWIGSAASQLYISSDTTTVGHIGTIRRHMDISRKDDMEGVKRTFLHAGKYKAVGADNKPLSDDDGAILQAELDYVYTIFVEAVSKHRGVDVQVVLDDMAEARIFTGQQAIDAGLVDGVATIDELIAAMSGGELPTPADFSAGALNETLGDVLVAALEADLDDTADTETKEEAIMPESKLKEFVITKGAVLDKAPDVAEAFREEGKASIDIETIKAEAATAERERIEAVLDQSMPGHEQLITTLAFDGVTTGPEAAVKVLQATKEAGKKIAGALDADGEALQVIKPSADNSTILETDGNDEIDANATVEDRAKAAWDKDAEIRGEFTSLATYTAYLKAEEAGQVKSFGQKTA